MDEAREISVQADEWSSSKVTITATAHAGPNRYIETMRLTLDESRAAHAALGAYLESADSGTEGKR